MKILIIEDEIDIATSIKIYLSRNDFICESANSLKVAIEKIDLYSYDCILLDLMLTDGDGFKILELLKKQNKTEGVIIISAKDTLETKIEGLTLGADDYLTKPFHLSELLVRIQALIRRKQFNGNNVISFNEIEIDTINKSIKIRGNKIEFTKKEMDLLLFLVGNKNKVLSKSAIAEHLSGDMADMLDNYDFVYAHIKNMKKKLKEMGATDYLKSIYGTGYKWGDE
ncbi:response regulator transcription factor [Flavobacterium eburneipallidum]|jgi:DNA-binding response OmpR family regulator|uniref:response regulator transcription factor n=1 Tax=Flavobacterium eburneipallidum TaxID=3003263 RepID=UPI002482E69B|nr:response regulator transcription factor [Flavobacterium eburneipallidum]